MKGYYLEKMSVLSKYMYISKYMILIFLALFLFACQYTLKSYKTAKALDFEKDVFQQAIHKACLWLDKHPVNLEVEEPLAILEEVIAFYILWKNTEDTI